MYIHAKTLQHIRYGSLHDVSLCLVIYVPPVRLQRRTASTHGLLCLVYAAGLVRGQPESASLTQLGTT